MAYLSSSEKCGSVRVQEKRIVEFVVDINSDELALALDDHNAEYVITVNGRVIKRMSPWQLKRLLGIPAN